MAEIGVVVLGHKDHGKSTLISRLILDSGSIKRTRVEEVREIARLANRPFELAHLVDSFREERENQMTMDTTAVPLKGKIRGYRLIDVPGHAELIAHMLTGASAADVALLVVSVIDGIQAQTRQHLEIARLLGIEQAAVVVTKMDMVGYSDDAFIAAGEAIGPVLRRAGYDPEITPFIPASAATGENVMSRSARIRGPGGSSVMEFLETGVPDPKLQDELPFCFVVQYVDSGAGAEVAVGRLETGRLGLGEEIYFLPGVRTATVSEILDGDGSTAAAHAGQNVGLVLDRRVGVDRGHVGVGPAHFVNSTSALLADLFWLRPANGRRVVCECGAAQVAATVEEARPAPASHHSSWLLGFDSKLVVDLHHNTSLSKLVLKDAGEIVAVGCPCRK